MARKRNKPHDPAAQARQNFQAVGLQADQATLPQNAAIEVTRAGEHRAGQTVKEDSARRLDVFEALRPSMKRPEYVGAYDAARRLERDLMISLGQHDHGRPVERVQHEQAAFCRVDAMIDASKRCMAIRDRLPERDAWLLWELITPSRGWDTWRAAVAHITGETNWNAQGAAVRAACVNLRDAYEKLYVVRQKVA